MKLTYDPVARAFYLYVRADERVARTRIIAPDEDLADLGAGGRLLGIESLSARGVAGFPEVLAEYGVPVPRGVDFARIAAALEAGEPVAPEGLPVEVHRAGA